MRKITLLLLSAFMVFSFTSWGQSTTIDFELDGDGYTPSATEGSGFTDVFNRTNPDIGGNGTYMWSVEDLTLINPSITLDQIDLTGATDFTFSIDMIAHHFNDWDNTDELIITYSIDGGAYQNLMWVQSITDPASAYNEPAALDTDFNGDGECAYVLPALTMGTGALGCVVTSNVFETFTTSAIPLSSNSTLDILLQFNVLDATDEGIYLDNININLSGGATTPLISVAPSSLSGFTYVFNAGPSASQSFTVEGSDLTADIIVTPSASYEISDDDVTFQSTAITLSQSGGSVSASILYTRLKAGLAAGDYNEDITCSSTGATDKLVSCGGTVEAPATTILPYSETFDADLGDCYTYSVSGATKEWGYASFGANGYADINGYDSGDTEEDWLILPGIDFDSYSNEIMSFDTWWQYGTDDANNYMKLYYSPDYPGIGDPTGYTWTELSYTLGATQTWTSSGVIDLSAITGTSVYIAFKYLYEDGNYRHMEVDNISIVPSVPVNVTFQVNMSEAGTISGDGVHVAGSFNGWNPAATLMTDAGGGIYTVTLPLMSLVEYQFKYLNGNAWGTEEVVPTGCETGSNRTEVTSSPDYSIPVVCFGSCVDCGGAYFDITFQVDMQNEIVSGDVFLAGSFTDWGTSPIAMTQNGTIWSTTVSLQENSPEEYKFINGGTWEFIGNRMLTIPSANTIIDVDCFNSYDACPVADYVMINEVDADQVGTDANEFIELYDGGVGNTSLSGLVVVLFNGSDDQSYNDAIDLDGQSTDENGYFVIGSATVPNVDLVAFTTNGLQNGADAVALFVGDGAGFPNDTPIPADLSNLLDALVYDTGDGDDAALLVLLNAGEPQIDERGRNDGDLHSNQRIPNGTGGLRNTYTYDQSPPTPGAENIGVFTDWHGNNGSVWNDDLNWTNGIPTSTLNAEIPDLNKGLPIISGSAACLNLYMASGSSLEIAASGDLTVYGTFTNNGALNIKSDATGTGSLIESDGVYANVENFLSQDAWHYLATPIDDANTSVFNDLYMMWWDEAAEVWDWVLSADSTLATDMQGYSVWANDDATLAYTGGLNTGAKSIAVTNTATTPIPDPDPTNDPSGFNFVGNPYSSALDWNIADGSGWTRTSENIASSLYIWNQVYGNYGVYVKDAPNGTNDVTNVIPSQQGFFVFCTANGTLGVDNGARMHSNSNVYKGDKDENPFVKLHVYGNGLQDEFMVNVNSLSTSGYDNMFDGLKMKGSSEAPQVYSLTTDGDRLSINSLPEVSQNMTIPVGFNAGVEAVYEITLNELNGFDETPLYLEDLIENVVVDIKSDTYIFTGSPEDIAERFQLHFFIPSVIGSNELLTSDNIYVFASDNVIYIRSNEQINGDVSVYDMLGQEVVTLQINNTINKISLNKFGYYIVKVMSENNVVTKKVFIK